MHFPEAKQGSSAGVCSSEGEDGEGDLGNLCFYWIRWNKGVWAQSPGQTERAGVGGDSRKTQIFGEKNKPSL